MKDENIKEILDNINCALKIYERDKKLNQVSPKSIYFLSPKEQQILLDYITNLQEIEKEHKNCTRKHWQQKCAEHCVNEMIYKSRNEKALKINQKLQSMYILDSRATLWLWKQEKILQGDDKDVKDKR